MQNNNDAAEVTQTVVVTEQSDSSNCIKRKQNVNMDAGVCRSNGSCFSVSYG
jgi:hypothetical protein